MRHLLLLLFVCSSAVAADQPPTFSFYRDAAPPHAVLTITPPPTATLTLMNDAGELIVEISLKDGTVRVAKTGKDDEAARRFWKAIQTAFNAPKCKDVR